MKHKRTKATEIPPKVKQIVWERDGHRCIYCKRQVPVFFANSHFVKRSQGGLGIPENTVTACLDCHNCYDREGHEIMYPYTEQYLKSKYENWDINKLVYNKYEE